MFGHNQVKFKARAPGTLEPLNYHDAPPPGRKRERGEGNGVRLPSNQNSTNSSTSSSTTWPIRHLMMQYLENILAALQSLERAHPTLSTPTALKTKNQEPKNQEETLCNPSSPPQPGVQARCLVWEENPGSGEGAENIRFCPQNPKSREINIPVHLVRRGLCFFPPPPPPGLPVPTHHQAPPLVAELSRQ